MTHPTSRSICRLLIILLAFWGAPRTSAAQEQQATTLEDLDYGCILIICGSITNANAAIDNDITTGAYVSPPLALSSAALRVGFASEVPRGARVSLRIGTNGGLLNLNVANQTSISTFASHTGAALQTIKFSSLLNLNILNDNSTVVTFVATQPFTQVELRTGSLLAVNIGYSVQLYQATATMNPLPVELVAFTGKARTGRVELAWNTASERSSAYFAVERSANAQDAFQSIGKVTAAGNSSRPTDYRFVDAQPLALGYYRLRQVDMDGTTSYSPLIAVTAAPALALEAYPNPSNGRLTLTGPLNTRFALVNSLGKVVQQGELTLSQTYELDFSRHPDGLYFLRDQSTGATVKVTKAGQ